MCSEGLLLMPQLLVQDVYYSYELVAVVGGEK